MLDGTGNTDGNIEVWRHDLAGLADLIVVRDKAGINGSARGADGRAELVGHFFQHGEVGAVLHAAATGDDDRRAGQFRALRAGELGLHIGRQAAIRTAVDSFDRSAAALCCSRLKGGAADGDDLDRFARCHGGDGVTCIDRALECIGALDLDDVGDLHHVEQGGNTRHDVLAGGGCRSHQVAVARCHRLDQRCDVLGNAVRHGVGLGGENLRHAGNCGGGLGHIAAGVARDEDMDVATDLGGCGHGVQRGGCQLAVVMVCQDQDAHDQITFASFFSLSTSSPTSDTLIPASRAGGSSTRVMARRGVTSTPSSSALIESSGFFFAFMMFGSDA